MTTYTENVQTIQFVVSKMNKTEKIALIMSIFDFRDINSALKLMRAEHFVTEMQREIQSGDY